MKKAIKKSEVLLEALPYIQAFHNKVFVIKYGGSSLGDERIRESVLKDIVFMHYVGIKPVIVHGGGPNITKALKEKGVKARFIDGIRYTDSKTLRVVKKELNSVNKMIVEELKGMNCPAEGITEKNAILKAEQKKKELGFVGEIIGVNANPVFSLLNKNIVPVISPIAVGKDGRIYNVNADIAAAEISVALGAEKIVFLTNVDGILVGKKVLSSAKADKIRSLVNKSIITGGMLPKVSAGLLALDKGVNKAHIVNAKKRHGFLLEIFTNKGIGTEILRGSKMS